MVADDSQMYGAAPVLGVVLRTESVMRPTELVTWKPDPLIFSSPVFFISNQSISCVILSNCIHNFAHASHPACFTCSRNAETFCCLARK